MATLCVNIVKNRYHLNSDKCFRPDLVTPHHLTVFDKQARPALDIEYINNRTVKILGDFYFRNGRHVVIHQDQQLIGNMVKMNGGVLTNMVVRVF